MSYLIPEDFEVSYPQGRFLSAGTYGRVYLSGTDTVVKEITGVTPIRALDASLKELNVYSSLDHPCVVEMKNWTFTPDTFKIALPLGLSPGQAVQSGLLTFRQAVSDLLSGLTAIYEIGLAHNDIKSANIIYHNGHLKFIDFGLATPIRIYLNTATCIDSLQTVDHRDPVINFVEESDLRVELYAIAGVLAHIFKNINNVESYPLPFDLDFGDFTDNAIYQDLIRYPLSTRPDVYEFFQKYPVLTLHTGYLLETPVYPLGEMCSQGLIINVYEFLMWLARKSRMQTQSFFLALHLFRRSLPLVFPFYSRDPNQSVRVKSLAGVCFLLANIILDDQITLTFDDVAYFSEQHYSWQQIRDMTIGVISHLRGIILTKTPWNFANNLQDLSWGYLNLLSCDYEPTVTTSLSGNGDKSLSIDDFYQFLNRNFSGRTFDFLKANFPPLIPATINFPVQKNFIDTGVSINNILNTIEYYNNLTNPGIEDEFKLGKVLHFDYSNLSSGIVNNILRLLRLTSTGSKYAYIIETQLLLNSPVMIE